MKRKSVWLVLSCLMALSLIMASCAAAEVEEEEEVVTPGEEEVVPVEEEEGAAGPEMVPDAFGNLKEKPRYGGTITAVFYSGTPTTVLDPVISTRAASNAVLTYSRLGTADWSKGPQGTNEFPFTSSWIPDEFCAGDVAESWEVPDPYNLVFRIRENVYWHNVPPMNGRQFTADDVIYSQERSQGDPQNVAYAGQDVPEDESLELIKIDEFTVQFKFGPATTLDTYTLHGRLNWLYMQPREVVEQYGDISDPKHQVGTGPWVVTDVVSDSSMTWKRNPNYHLSDPFFPENRLPYADKLEAIVIPDESTRLAALRTGKIDRLGVPWDKVEGLKKTNPELLWKEVLPDGATLFWVRTDIEPFNDKSVRQAVSMAIDQPAIAEEYYGGNAYLLMWPMMPSFSTVYTPLDELPETSRMLYEHQPDLAKQLLAEAGYPDGFKTEVIVSSTAPRWIDVCAIVKEYLAEVGIDMEIRIQEPTTYGSTLYGKQYPGMMYLGSWSNNGIDDALGWANGGWVGSGGAAAVYNFGNVVDPVAQELFESLPGIVDEAERTRVRIEANERGIDMCWEIPVPTASAYFFWVPWLRGYAGEVGVGPDPPENYGVYMYCWIDQDLKYEMTGKR